jgi:hypothetical protein
VTLTGLLPDSTYQYTAHALDAAGNQGSGSTQAVHTPVTPPDAQPPVVTLTAPGAGIVAGNVLLAANATDNVGVVGVQFRVDGAAAGAELLSPPYEYVWDSTLVADGPHTVSVHARDALGNVGTASVVVTVRNTPVASTPHFVELDGANDYLEAADAPALSFGTGAADTPLTLELWFRPDTMAGKQQLLSKWAEPANTEYRLYVGGGVIRIDLRDASANAMISVHTGTQTALAGSWHHLAVTYDGRGGATAADGITIYIDGTAVPVTRVNHPAYVAMENLAASLQVGRESASWKQFDGGLDEIRFWNVARTLGQIQAFRTVALSGGEPGLVAYWRLDEGTGASSEDLSPGNLTLGLFSGAAWVSGAPPAFTP